MLKSTVFKWQGTVFHSVSQVNSGRAVAVGKTIVSNIRRYKNLISVKKIRANFAYCYSPWGRV